MRPKIKITFVDKKCDYVCHNGYEIGKNWHFDKDRGGFFLLPCTHFFSW